MKKYILIVAIIASLSFTGNNSNPSAAAAEVNQVEGFYIFTDSKPASEYDYIGTVKCNVVQYAGGTNFSEVTYIQLRDNLIKQAKKKFTEAKKNAKTANAIIIHPESNTGDLITLK